MSVWNANSRQGIVRLLQLYESASLGEIDVDTQEETIGRVEGPWIVVRLDNQEFGIWKATGNVYRIVNGAAEDDPFITVDEVTDNPR